MAKKLRSKVILSDGPAMAGGREKFIRQQAKAQYKEAVKAQGPQKIEVVNCRIKATNCNDYDEEKDLCMAVYRCIYKVRGTMVVNNESEDDGGTTGSQD